MSGLAPSPELVQHLDRAAEWRLLSQILSYPGDGWARRVELLLECIRDPGLAKLARTALKESSPGLWLSLFGPAGPVRARAVAWDGGLQPGYLLAGLSAFYEAFAYEPPADEAPDQLAVLLDFAAWLELKIAYAVVQHDTEAAERARRALETFLARFVAPAAWPVFRQLERAGPPFFAAAARLAAERSGPEPEAVAAASAAWPDRDAMDELACPGSPPAFVSEALIPDITLPAEPERPGRSQ